MAATVFVLSILALAAVAGGLLLLRTNKALLQRLGPPLYSDHGSLRVGWWQFRSPLGTILIYPTGFVLIYVKTAFIEWNAVKAIRRTGIALRTLTIEHDSPEAGSPVVVWPAKGVSALVSNLERAWGHPIG